MRELLKKAASYRWGKTAAVLSIGVSIAVGLAVQAETRAVTAIKCGTVLDMTSDRARSNMVIVVENGRITAIGDATPDGATVIDRSGATCLPGLTDLHTHLMISMDRSVSNNFTTFSSADKVLMALRNAQTMLHHGFTTLRVPGDLEYEFGNIALRNAINRGEFVGPRMLVAPHMLSETGGHGDLNEIAPDVPEIPGTVVKSGVDNVREAVRREIKYGADWIKISASGGVMSQHDDPKVQGFTDEEINAFAEEAHRRGKKITAHVHGDSAGYAAAAAGFDSIEHGTLLSDRTLQLMKKNDVALVSTSYVVNWILNQGVQGGISADNLQKAQEVSVVQRKVLKKAYDMGIKIGFGTDQIFPHAESPREFATLVNLGFKPIDALKAATINAAEILGLEAEIGTLAVGKAADIVAVPGDPLADITIMEKVDFVMKGGKVIRAD